MDKAIVLKQGPLRAPSLSGRLQSGLLLLDNLNLGRHLGVMIAARAAILLLGINLARALQILPERIGALPFLPLANLSAIGLTLAYLALWRHGRRLPLQLVLQIAVDLALTTCLVAITGGIASPFVSFYVLVIIACSLTGGRSGGLAGAALSAILYAGIVGAENTGILAGAGSPLSLENLTFRVSLNALGFFGVALLGACLSRRLSAVQEELEEKIDSLTRLRRLNENIVSSIRSGLITTNLGGRITLFNNTAEELTGIPVNDVLAAPLPSVIGSRLWARVRDADLFRDARPLRDEYWVDLPGGQRRYLGFSVSPLMDQERELIGYIVSFQDLTEIKHLEEEVRLKDRMATIGSMAAGIAHEIRNPLTSMRGSVEILKSRSALSERDRRLLEILLKESDRLNKFIGELLQFAVPTKSAMQPVDLASLLQDSVLLLQNGSGFRSRYSVTLQLDSNSLQIEGNADRLKQVFWNLAQNALRAMPDGGHLGICAGPEEGAKVQVVFKDNGMGMTTVEQERLSRPLNPGFSTGTGLGLHIVYQIVEEHRGQIRFDSEKGKGTRVTLHFPAIAG